MEYSRFLAIVGVLVISSLTIYLGCLRSYGIYFFERDSRRVVFLEPWSAAAVPIVLSFMLILTYVTSKRSQATSEELTANSLRKSSQASTKSMGSRNFSRSSDLESIPESPECALEPLDSASGSVSGEEPLERGDEPAEDAKRKLTRKSGIGAGDQLEDDLSEENINITRRLFDQIVHDRTKNKGSEIDSDVLAVQPNRCDEEEEDWLPSRKSSAISTGSRQVQRAQRKQSEIYKQIGRIDLVPMSLKKISFQVAEPPSIRKFRKDSWFDVVMQLFGIHLPIWLSVTALYIALVEIFNMKFYTMFYYHHPGVKLLAMTVAVAVGIFHELSPTYLVNDILGIAGAYIVISRIQTVSYVAGVIFLVGMILFDLFWMYGIDLFSTVTQEETSAPIMLIIPWNKQGKKESLATLDIMVPGIFLNILLKFADMYDSRGFFPPFYATVVGLMATFALAQFRGKSTPAMVLPAIFAVVTSLLSVHRVMDLWRFEIKH